MGVTVKLKKLDENAVLPFKKNESDFCYDVVAVSEEEVAPNVWRYKFGFAYEMDRESLHNDIRNFMFAATVDNEIEFDDKLFNISIDARPRSSIWKTGMILANCEGTLDELYRGECMAVFYHIMPDMPRYKVGDRICQIKLGLTIPMEFEWADEININTERGTGGFGSTGLK